MLEERSLCGEDLPTIKTQGRRFSSAFEAATGENPRDTWKARGTRWLNRRNRLEGAPEHMAVRVDGVEVRQLQPYFEW